MPDPDEKSAWPANKNTWRPMNEKEVPDNIIFSISAKK